MIEASVDLLSKQQGLPVVDSSTQHTMMWQQDVAPNETGQNMKIVIDVESTAALSTQRCDSKMWLQMRQDSNTKIVIDVVINLLHMYLREEKIKYISMV